MDVKLTVAWVDQAGVRHSAGDVVEVDPVTLAKLEERHMVEPEETVETTEDGYLGPGKVETTTQGYLGPGKIEAAEVTEQGYLGPGKVETTTQGYLGPGKVEAAADATAE